MSPTPRAAVAVPMELRLLVPAQQALPLPVFLRFCVDDPYAVSVAFQGPDEEVTWVFARDLLADGLDDARGEGDVTVRPCRREGRDVLVIGLVSPDGAAELEADPAEVRAFIELCESVLPRGQEHTVLDLDAELKQLLAR